MPMRAFAVDRFGDTGSIHDLPIPTPGEGEVLVRVHAAGVNVMDPMYVAGWLKDYMEHRFPLVAGIDLSGVVEAIGPGVSGFAPGDEVYGVSAKPFVGEAPSPSTRSGPHRPWHASRPGCRTPRRPRCRTWP